MIDIMLQRARERKLYRLSKGAKAVTHGDFILVLHDKVAEQPRMLSGPCALLHLLGSIHVNLSRLIVVHPEDAARDLRHAAFVGGAHSLDGAAFGLLLVRTAPRHMTRLATLEAGTFFMRQQWF